MSDVQSNDGMPKKRTQLASAFVQIWRCTLSLIKSLIGRISDCLVRGDYRGAAFYFIILMEILLATCLLGALVFAGEAKGKVSLCILVFMFLVFLLIPVFFLVWPPRDTRLAEAQIARHEMINPPSMYS